MAYSYSVRRGIEHLKIKTSVAFVTITGTVVASLFMATLLPVTADALTSTAYNAVPSILPPNVASLGFEATSTSEFGDYVHLGGTDRKLNSVTVTMSDWALYSDYASNPAYSGNSASWSHPITVNIYDKQLGANGVPTTLLATKTATITVPWRPAADVTCPGGTAYRASDGNCYNGIAFNANFDMSSLNVTLPNDVIVGVAYNTADYGANPLHQAGPYNSLNVGIPNGQTATVGTDDSSDNVFMNTSYAGFYTDGGAGGVGTFRQDTNWIPNGTVAFRINTLAPLSAPTITSPFNGAYLTSAQLNKIDWTDASGANPVTYQYQSFTDAGYTNLAFSSIPLSASEIPTPGTPVGNYYVQVRAMDADGSTSPWSNNAANPYVVHVIAPAYFPVSKNDCKNNGWKTYTNPSFKNQGQCVDWVEAQAVGSLKLGSPNQQIIFSIANSMKHGRDRDRGDRDDSDRNSNFVEYWNYDYQQAGAALHYRADVSCSYVNPQTHEARFVFQVPAGHPGLSGLYILAYAKQSSGKNSPNQYGHTATADQTAATNWCQTGLGFTPTMYPVTKGTLEIN